MLPDAIFLISDASFQWREGGSLSDVPWQEIARVVKGPLQGTGGCVVNFIGFQMKPEDRRKMESVVRSTRGKFAKFNRTSHISTCESRGRQTRQPVRLVSIQNLPRASSEKTTFGTNGRRAGGSCRCMIHRQTCPGVP